MASTVGSVRLLRSLAFPGIIESFLGRPRLDEVDPLFVLLSSFAFSLGAPGTEDSWLNFDSNCGCLRRSSRTSSTVMVDRFACLIYEKMVSAQFEMDCTLKRLPSQAQLLLKKIVVLLCLLIYNYLFVWPLFLSKQAVHSDSTQSCHCFVYQKN